MLATIVAYDQAWMAEQFVWFQNRNALPYSQCHYCGKQFDVSGHWETLQWSKASN
ncbi:MAG TPA: hypothetical protein VF700_01040 [Segetibacter sp.]